MSTSTQDRETVPLAVPVSEVAKILGISVRHVWSLLSQGRLPRPIRLGRSARWNLEELREWLSAGAPDVGDRKHEKE